MDWRLNFGRAIAIVGFASLGIEVYKLKTAGPGHLKSSFVFLKRFLNMYQTDCLPIRYRPDQAPPQLVEVPDVLTAFAMVLILLQLVTRNKCQPAFPTTLRGLQALPRTPDRHEARF